MKNKLEHKLDAEFGRIGVKTRTYPLRKHVWPFTGVTIVIESNDIEERKIKR